jgi:hypothetical protein
MHRNDRGSASVESLGVSVLVTILALAILQFAVIAHVRAVVVDSAIAGAAFGSYADSTLTAGIERTRYLLEIGVAADLIESVSGRTTTIRGRPVRVVTVNYRVPAFALWVPSVSDRVSARAFVERP